MRREEALSPLPTIMSSELHTHVSNRTYVNIKDAANLSFCSKACVSITNPEPCRIMLLQSSYCQLERRVRLNRATCTTRDLRRSKSERVRE
jgi:hypothetical protein